jgi:hypothetical protein
MSNKFWLFYIRCIITNTLGVVFKKRKPVQSILMMVCMISSTCAVSIHLLSETEVEQNTLSPTKEGGLADYLGIDDAAVDEPVNFSCPPAANQNQDDEFQLFIEQQQV